MLFTMTGQGATTGAMTIVFEQRPLPHRIRRNDGLVEIYEIGIVDTVP